MAFLAPDFAHDVFVSYSHGDPNRIGDTALKRWTGGLIDELRDFITSLDVELGNVDIWFDKLVDPTSHLTEELRNQVKSSGILMVVITDHYLRSSWCKDELDWFREQIKDRSVDQGRVFVIKAQPTDEARWPDFLRDERGNSPIGFTFYDSQSRMPYGWPDRRCSDNDFTRELSTLYISMTRRLRELRDRARSRAAASPATPVGAGRRVYLHARSENISLRDSLRLQLREEGLTPMSPVIGEGASLGDWSRASKTRIETAKRCQALALVRADDSQRFLDDLLDIGVEERAQIEEARGTPLPCAVLDGSGADLGFDETAYGIRRFDLGDTNWRSAFRSWIDTAQAQTAQVSPA